MTTKSEILLERKEKQRRNAFSKNLFDCRNPLNETIKNRAIEEMAKLAKTLEEWTHVRIHAAPESEPAKRAIRAIKEMEDIVRRANEKACLFLLLFLLKKV
jgi:hypothetical protein